MRDLLNDAELLRRCQTGDQEAFRQLYERYAPQVYAFLLGYLRDPDGAADVTQETFVRLWQALPRYREQGQFRAWLFRIARRLAIDAARSRRRRRHFPLQEIRPPLRDKAKDPGEILEQKQAVEEVMAALEHLKAEYREVLVLRFLLDMNVAETAAVMGRSPGAVRVLQHRALHALRRVLSRLSEQSDQRL